MASSGSPFLHPVGRRREGYGATGGSPSINGGAPSAVVVSSAREQEEGEVKYAAAPPASPAGSARAMPVDEEKRSRPAEDKQRPVQEITESFEALRKQMDEQHAKEIGAENYADAQAAYEILLSAVYTEKAFAFWNRSENLSSPCTLLVGGRKIPSGVFQLYQIIYKFRQFQREGDVLTFPSYEEKMDFLGKLNGEPEFAKSETPLSPITEGDLGNWLKLYDHFLLHQEVTGKRLSHSDLTDQEQQFVDEGAKDWLTYVGIIDRLAMQSFYALNEAELLQILARVCAGFSTPKPIGGDTLSNCCLYFFCNIPVVPVAAELYAAIQNTIVQDREGGRLEFNLDSLLAFITKYPELAPPELQNQSRLSCRPCC